MLRIDLVADMANIMRKELQEIGYKVNVPDDRELMMYYFTICMRIVKTKPRRVHEAAGIVVPPSRQAGYDALKEKFVRGVSVLPHMSKQIKGLKFQDKMLFDWGIHHFHLGTLVDADGFVKQYDEIVYAIVEENDVYFINVLDHEHWSDRNLLEIVLANWSHLLASFRLDGELVTNFTSEQVEELRKSNVNTALTLSDGHGYIGRGMGLTSAGTSSSAALDANHMIRDLKRIEKDIKEQNQPMGNEFQFFSLSRTPDAIYLDEPYTGYSQQLFAFQSLKKKLS